MIDKEDLQAVCDQFQLGVSGQVLDDLIDYCDMDKDGLINFLEFANFLNWKDKMPIKSREQRILTNGQLNALSCICQFVNTRLKMLLKILGQCGGFLQRDIFWSTFYVCCLLQSVRRAQLQPTRRGGLRQNLLILKSVLSLRP